MKSDIIKSTNAILPPSSYVVSAHSLQFIFLLFTSSFYNKKNIEKNMIHFSARLFFAGTKEFVNFICDTLFLHTQNKNECIMNVILRCIFRAFRVTPSTQNLVPENCGLNEMWHLVNEFALYSPTAFAWVFVGNRMNGICVRTKICKFFGKLLERDFVWIQ